MRTCVTCHTGDSHIKGHTKQQPYQASRYQTANPTSSARTS